jgi:osmotically-inducible protein OsmY
MRSDGEPIDVETYNQVIKLVGFVRDSIEKRIELLEVNNIGALAYISDQLNIWNFRNSCKK